ncbi:MAG TPA: hypothetical protein VM219_02620 [Phycisphaerae bacterium]|nr:hypothetical protein [Phycisphaerae bacterium]
MTETDKASVFVELARINQEQLWRRRQIEWKINFLLWGSTAAVAGYLYSQVDTERIKDLLVIVYGVFAVTFITYVAHLLNCLLSDEMDMAWMHYFKQQAELALGLALNREKLRPHPSGLSKWTIAWKPETRKKYCWHFAMVVVTLLLMVAECKLVESKTKHNGDLKATEAAVARP